MNGKRVIVSRDVLAGRWVAWVLLLALLITGCSPEWRRKFIRKKKDVTPVQPVLVLQSDVEATHPPEVRYQAHFAYWKSWHSELVQSLGQIRKRDIRYLNGTIGELRAMREVLSGPPAERLTQILTELHRLQEKWEQTSEPWNHSAAVRTRLEQLKREIDKKLHYSKVKEWIVTKKAASPLS